jgi:hypothetical protein
VQVIYGYQKLDTCSMDSMDLGPNSNHLGVMITLRMRLECSIVRRGQSQPEQVREQTDCKCFVGVVAGATCGSNVQ